MKRFLAVYVGTMAAVEKARAASKTDEEWQQNVSRGMEAWGAWMERQKARILDAGGPLGKTKKIGPDGIADTRNTASGYIVLEADSHEAAAELFRDHPHFSIFPGDSVEVMEILPIPSGE